MSVAAQAASAMPSNALPVLSGESLLRDFERQISALRERVAVAEPEWDNLYRPLLLNFAAFVQGSPASEVHHHAGERGLLKHGLEAAVNAASQARNQLLPPDGSEASREQWLWAAVTAALLHDIAKPLCDQTHTLFDNRGRELGRWLPLTGPMTRTAAASYSVAFRPGRKYALHQLSAPLLVHHIVGASGLSLLFQDIDLFTQWLACISGQREASGILGKLVQSADQTSVAADLGGKTERIAAGESARSLGENLVAAVGEVLRTETVNKPGAVAFIESEWTWVVSKRGLDAARGKLSSMGVSVPADNVRLMDELQQHGLIAPTAANKSVHKCRITLGDDWSKELTMLKFATDRLFPQSTPALFAGTVEEPSPPASSNSQTEDAEDAGSAQATGIESGTDDIKTEDNRDELEHYLDWLVENVGTNQPVNTAAARFHVVDGGLLVVSPAAFTAFSSDSEVWKTIQRRFRRMECVDAELTVWEVRETGSELKGFLVSDPLSLGLDLPNEPNENLRRIVGDEKAEKATNGEG